MLCCTVELWDGRESKTLHKVNIVRDRGDDPRATHGNYTVTAVNIDTTGRDRQTQRQRRVLDFDRSRGALALVEEALRALT